MRRRMKNKVSRLQFKMMLCTLLLTIICLFFASCSTKDESKPLPVINEQEKTIVSAQGITPEPARQEPIPAKAEKVVESWEEYESSRFPLLAAIPDKNIYLYGIKSSGVILYVEEEGHYYDWPYLTPRLIWPRMYLSDFDADGRDELAVILYIGSGTGVSIEDLHIIELNKEEDLSDFKDHSFGQYDYLSQLEKLVKLKTYDKSGELMADIKIEGRSYTAKLKDIQSLDYGSIDDNPCFGSIVRFNVEDGKLKVQFALGVTCEAFATPFYIGDINADVRYFEGKFVLSNLSFEENKE